MGKRYDWRIEKALVGTVTGLDSRCGCPRSGDSRCKRCYPRLLQEQRCSALGEQRK